jgi:3-hydroxy-9,10-secoandrosta-1,3,5(10)-triene-9,17-dione monooxygenase
VGFLECSRKKTSENCSCECSNSYDRGYNSFTEQSASGNTKMVQSPNGANASGRLAHAERTAQVRETVLQKIKKLGPVLSEHAALADETLCLSQPVVNELKTAGLFRIWQPERYNGFQTDILTQVLVTSELGKYCSSAAWVTALCTATGWLAGLYSEVAQEEVFGADNDARVCGVLAPTATIEKVRGGIRVDGRWGYASGSDHATWATLAAPRKDGGEGTDLLLIPMTDLTIDLTWDPSGMRGTASNTLCASGVFVPDHRILPFFCADGVLAGITATEFQNETLFRAPVGVFAAISIAGPLIGMAKAALEMTLDHIVDRPVAYTFAEDQSSLVSTQLAVAEAATKIDSAELHIHRAASDCDEYAEAAGGELDLRARARTRHDVGWGSQLLREAMSTLQQVNGSSFMTRRNSFERIWRDFHTSSLHGLLSAMTTAEVYGKVLCGHDPNPFSSVY